MMHIYLFLEGPPRIGKSTIIRNNLLPYADFVAGLMVQRLYENGRICGFRACLADGCLSDLEAAYSSDLQGVFLYRGEYHAEILDQMICSVSALCAKSSCRLILLDEIGGLELSSPIFNNTLKRLLTMGKPCIGVVKSRHNLLNLLHKLNFSNSILNESVQLRRLIEAGGEVLFVNEYNLEKTDQGVKSFLKTVL